MKMDHPSQQLGDPIFTIPVRGGLPAFRSLLSSAALHAVAIGGLAFVHVSNPTALAQKRPELRPTEIRIGDHLYFVSELTSHAPAEESAPKRIAETPRRQTRRATPAPRREAKLTAPAPKQQNPAPRVFTPPEIRHDPIRQETLIQPQTPPQVVPPQVRLPSFQIWTARLDLPKFSRPFVAPGQKRMVPPAPSAPLPPPPPLDLVHAPPAPSVNPKLTLPPPPPGQFDTAAVKQTTTPPPIPQGDPLNIVSLSDHSAPAMSKLIVPAGNVVGRTGQGSGGTDANAASGQAQKDATGIPAGGPPASQGNAQRAEAGTGARSEPGSLTGGSRAALNGTGASNPASGVTISGSGTVPGGSTSPVVITQPANGNFDAVVVQTGIEIPNGKDLLSGRPVYTVYIPVGATKDWALYFCVPGEKPPEDSGTRVVQISNAAPVRAPYPTRIVRPAITLPSYEKYVLVHGFVSDSGRFRDLKIVGDMLPQTSQALLASLDGWEFRAATRDGTPVTVEFLLSIPALGL